MHEGDLERGMLKHWPKFDITHSNQYHVRAQDNKVKPLLVQSHRNNTAGHYDLHRFESDAECFAFIDSLLADNK
jgi:hypothetical protein